MVLYFEDSFYEEGESQKEWTDFSPLLATSFEKNRLRGIVYLPLGLEQSNALRSFVESVFSLNRDIKLQEVFPDLKGEKNCDLLTSSREGVDFFSENSFLNWDDLGSTTLEIIEQLARARGWSRDQTFEFIAEATLRAFLGGEGWLLDHSKSGKVSPQPVLSDRIHPDLGELLLNRVQRAARFAIMTGHEKTPLADLLEGPNRLEPVQELFHQLGSLTSKDVLRSEVPVWSTAATLERLFQRLTERELDILTSRLFADTPESLQSIGDRYGVSRERIRQLESAAKKVALERFRSTPMLQDLSEYICRQISAIRPLEELLDAHAFLSEIVPSIDQPVWRVFDRLDISFEIEKNWCYVPDRKSVEDKIVSEFLNNANEHGVISLTDAKFITVGDPEQVDIYLDKWIEERGFTTYEGYLLTKSTSLVDRAAAILSIEGHALDIDAIVKRIPAATNRAGLRDRLRLDPRFARADKDLWALAEWDLPEYFPIRSLIEQELEKTGGRLSLEKLVANLTDQFTVSAASVIAYASNPPFETKDGFVRHAEAKRRIFKRPQDTSRFYRRGEAWIYNLRVTHDHVRGVSLSMPLAFADILGIQHGDRGTLASPEGPQTYSWASLSPQLGTVRRFLEKLEVSSGDRVFLIFGDNKTFDIEKISISGTCALEQALELIGRDSELRGSAALAEFAEAITLSRSAHRATIVTAYKHRGDDKIYDLLLEAQNELPDTAEIITHNETRSDSFDVSTLL